MAAAIEVRSVSKQFRLYHEHYTSLKERVVNFGRIPYEPFMALEDVDFDIEEGSTVGILGHNGSGKSTLLKCVAGILQPNAGRDRHPGPAGRAARARRGLQPRAHRPRERLHERVDPRSVEAGHHGDLRRDRRLRRAREVHRHAGAALLVGHVRAARLRGRRERRPRHPPRRRSAGRRRRGVPAQVHRAGQAVPKRRPHDPVRHARGRPRAQDLRPRPSCSTTARW